MGSRCTDGDAVASRCDDSSLPSPERGLRAGRETGTDIAPAVGGALGTGAGHRSVTAPGPHDRDRYGPVGCKVP
jgi:hypothetical protein